jgi:hypothetical protein
MILTELGGWVLIDKHENENSKISMTIMEHVTYNSDFQHKEYRTGHKYTTIPEQLKETTDARLMQQEVDKAMNAGINGLATILHPEEEETWYHPRTEYEEDKLIRQERTLRIEDPDVAMWVDRAFDMGINFSDIFRRINKVNPDFWNNYYRGAWIDRPQYYETHVEGKTTITEVGGRDRGRRMRIEQRAAHEDNNIKEMCKQMITERLTGITTVQHTREWEMRNGKEDFIHPWLNRPISKKEATQINELIKATERIGATNLDSVVAKATGVDQKLWNLTDNTHIPSRYWSFKGKQRTQRESKKREMITERKRTEGTPGPHDEFDAKNTKTVFEQLCIERITEIDQRLSTEHKREMEKEIAQSKVEDELDAYEGRPYSKEHNEIPEPDLIEYERGLIHKHPYTKKLEKEERAKEKKEIEEGRRLEAEWEAEEEKMIEDSAIAIETEEVDESPTFDIIKRATDEEHEYERQTISFDPSELHRSDERRDKAVQKEQSKHRRSTTKEPIRRGKRSQQKEQGPTDGENNQTKRTRVRRSARD